jgi:Cupin-like domain
MIMSEKSNSSVLDKRPDLAVERRAASGLPYAEFLQEYVATNRPVVVEGAVARWPAMQKWTPQFFKTRFGSKMVDVSYSDKMTFSDFIDAVEASSENAPGPYMYRLFLGPHLPELLADVSPQNIYSFPRRYACPFMPRVWRRPDGYLKLLIGGIGGKFPVMHYDGENAHAAITEIYGDKEFIVFPPEDTPFMYPRSDKPNQSQISDLEHPDLDQFPLFRNATRYQTVLRPGEMIFVPSRWWHSARVLSTSISVCQNILDASNWDGYVAEICQPARGLRSLKQSVKRLYLKGLGGLISTLEGTSRSKLAAGGFLGRRIAKLAPIEASETDVPTRWRVADWVVR